jgi:predicted O-methyltransferase YrrM
MNNGGMKNWTDDVPIGTKYLFEDALKRLPKNKKTNILEIGSYVGISLIEMLKILPEATGYVIDTWNINPVEKPTQDNINQYEIFRKNTEEYKERIEILTGDSNKILLELVREKKIEFDFIYVDGSHRCLDCHYDLVLGWLLLKKGGIMGIDDVVWNLNIDNELNIPYYGCMHFFDKYKDEYEVISKEYRVFLKKIV